MKRDGRPQGTNVPSSSRAICKPVQRGQWTLRSATPDLGGANDGGRKADGVVNDLPSNAMSRTAAGLDLRVQGDCSTSQLETNGVINVNGVAAAPPLLAEARAQRRSRLGGWRLLKGARKAGSCRAAGPSARPCDQQAGRGSCGCGAGRAPSASANWGVCRGRVFVFTGIKTHIAHSS